MFQHSYNLVALRQIFMKKVFGNIVSCNLHYCYVSFQDPSCVHDLQSRSLCHSVSAAVVFHRSNTPPVHLQKSWTLFTDTKSRTNARNISFHSKNTKTNSDRSIQVANSNQKCSHRPWAAPSGGQIFSRREIDKSVNWCSSRIKAMAKSTSWRTRSSIHLTLE